MAPGFVQTAEGKHHVEELIDEDIVNVNAEYSEVDASDIRWDTGWLNYSDGSY